MAPANGPFTSARNRLLRLITDKTWLAEAARVTSASRGARTAGIDGVDKEHMEGNLPAELSNIRTRLLAGLYEPSPARRVYIPKAGDKTMLRPLGIPSLRDRIVERAMLMAVQPIQLQDGDSQSLVGRWIIDGDPASYYDDVRARGNHRGGDQEGLAEPHAFAPMLAGHHIRRNCRGVSDCKVSSATELEMCVHRSLSAARLDFGRNAGIYTAAIHVVRAVFSK